jgi:hypothetical protein
VQCIGFIKLIWWFMSLNIIRHFRDPIVDAYKEYKGPKIGKKITMNDDGVYQVKVHYRNETYRVNYTPLTKDGKVIEDEDTVKTKIKGIAKTKIEDMVKLYSKFNDDEISSLSYKASEDATFVNTKVDTLSLQKFSEEKLNLADNLKDQKMLKEKENENEIIQTAENPKDGVNNLDENAKKETKKIDAIKMYDLKSKSTSRSRSRSTINFTKAPSGNKSDPQIPKVNTTKGKEVTTKENDDVPKETLNADATSPITLNTSTTKVQASQIVKTALDEFAKLSDKHHPGFEKSKPNESGVRNATIEIGETKYQIREFTKEFDYTGPRTEDLTNRLKPLYDTTQKLLEDEYKAHPKIKEEVDALYKKRAADLQNCEIVETTLEGLKNHPEAREAYVNRCIKSAKGILAQYVRDMSAILAAFEITDPKIDKAIDELMRKESEHIESQTRPYMINIYTINGQKHISIQEPVRITQTETIPSSIRNKAGLPNYVETFFGTIDADGNVSIEFEATRHSSPSPIGIENSYERKAIAVQNVENSIKDKALKILSSLPAEKRGAYKDKTLVISDHTMALLTPVRLDFLRNRKQGIAGEWTGESENLQLEEVMQSLNQINGREIKVKSEEGVTYTIKPDCSLLNFGTNEPAAGIGFFGKIGKTDLESKINAKGFSGFIDEMRNTAKYMEGFPFGASDKIDELNVSIKSASEGLPELYEELSYWQKAYLDRENASIKAKIEKEIRPINEMIKQQEEALFIIYQEKIEELAKGYDKEKIDTWLAIKLNAIDKQLDEDGLLNTLEAELKVLEEKLSDPDLLDSEKTKINSEKTKINNEIIEIIKDKLILQAFCSTLDLFFTKGYEKYETVKNLQAAYIIIQDLMNSSIKFYCKSAEDRTGDVNNLVEAIKIFIRNHHMYPVSEKDFKLINEDYLPTVYAQSASLSNTEWHGAAGLQIRQGISPDSIRVSSYDKTAKLAKGIYSKAKKMDTSGSAKKICKAIADIKAPEAGKKTEVTEIPTVTEIPV